MKTQHETSTLVNNGNDNPVLWISRRVHSNSSHFGIISTMSKTNDPDPFLKSLATLKEILSSPAAASVGEASPSRRRLSLGQRRNSSPRHSFIVAQEKSPVVAALEREVELEREQRKSLEKALEALTDARKILQTQLEAAKEQSAQHSQEYTALQAEMEQLKAQHAQELQQEQNKTAQAVKEKEKTQQAVDAAESRVASLELHVKEMQEKVKEKESQLKQVEQHHKNEQATKQKNIEVLLAELKKVGCRVGGSSSAFLERYFQSLNTYISPQTRAELKESKDKATGATKEAAAAKEDLAREKEAAAKQASEKPTSVTKDDDDVVTKAPETPKKRTLEDTATESEPESATKKVNT